MTKDKLKALQSVLQQRIERGEDEELGIENTALQIEDENAGYMEHFYREVEQIRSYIDEINENIIAIKALHSTLLSSPRPDQQLKQELDSKTEYVKSIAKKVSLSLRGLEKTICQEEEEIGQNGRFPAGLRIRRTQHSTTLHIFMEAMSTFNFEQLDYREKCTERIHRVISIAKAVVTDDKVEELLDQGNYGAIFSSDIITGTSEARKALEDVQARHQELIKLEKSIIELTSLFTEMSLLVEQQGDLVNNIENHVLCTQEHVEVANVETKKAIKYKKKGNLRLLIIIVILFLILLAVILTFIFWPKSA